MTIATGVAKQLRYKVESAWGTAPGATGAQLLRRVTSDLSLRKQTYQSNEIRSDYQRADMRHGVRSVEGTIAGELSVGTWEDLIAAALRRAFTAVNDITSLTLTLAVSGVNYTITRSAGSWITDGVKVGNVIRITAGAYDAANLNKNLFVLAEDATILTVYPLNGVALVAEGPIASGTVALPGKTTYAPASGHTDLSYSIEHYHADLTLSELFTGCKIQSMALQLPPSGMATINFAFLGRDITTAGAAYYTTPTAETSTGVLAAVNGVLSVQGTRVATLTGLDFTVSGNMSGEAVVGSNVYADIAEGRVLVDGNFTALFESATLRDYFIDETEVALSVALSASNAAAADFQAWSFPRIKVGGADKDDGEKNLIQTFPFTALYNSSGGAAATTEQSTLAVQDSQA
jgi:hypothetical protein